MLEIGKVYRVSRKEKNSEVKEVDGLPNFFHETSIPHAGTQFEVQRGIHVFAKVKGPDGKERIPMIFITSSPYKAGSEDTPWKDIFEPDQGRIKYYGDNKSSKNAPESVPGNKALLGLMQVYQTSDSEIRAKEGVPLLFFERVTVDGRFKGNLKFHGFGIATAAKRVTQYTKDKKSNRKDCFLNYQYDFVVFSLEQEHDKLDFVRWIGSRYNTLLTAEQTNQYAPQSWQDWINNGNVEKVRRVINGNKIIRYSEQLPDLGSAEYKLLLKIVEYYTSSTKICNFEVLAMEIIKKVIESNDVTCITGWILDNFEVFKNDFVVRMDVGNDFLTGIQVPVVGHAQCIQPTQAINNEDMKHLYDVAKPGWVTAYITTSFFSESVQNKALMSRCPVIMINGKKVAEIVHDELLFNKMSLFEYLDSLEERYQFDNKHPDEIINK